MGELIAEPWPWYVAGPLIGLVVPLLLWAGGEFVVSENLRHICAAALPIQNKFFRYDWKSNGLWNRTFALGIVLGAAVSRVGNLWPYDRAGQSTGQSIDPTTAARAPSAPTARTRSTQGSRSEQHAPLGAAKTSRTR